MYELLNEEKMSKSLSEADAKYVLNPFLDDVVMAEPDEGEDEFVSSSEEEERNVRDSSFLSDHQDAR